MVGHGGSSAGSYLADPTSPIPSHCASIVVTSTLRVNYALSVNTLYLMCINSELLISGTYIYIYGAQLQRHWKCVSGITQVIKYSTTWAHLQKRKFLKLIYLNLLVELFHQVTLYCLNVAVLHTWIMHRDYRS